MATRRDFLKSMPAAAGMTLAAHGFFSKSALAEPKAVNEKGEYVLPPLKYDYNALEPVIDEQTMRLHHDKHHAGYVAGVNSALENLANARMTGDFGLVQYYSGKAAFAGSGHIFHTIFWENMSPEGGGMPNGDLLKAINTHFGSFDNFKNQFQAASTKVEGSGWGVLAFEPVGGKLVVLQAEKHQNRTQWGAIPLLVVDVWEHAYYLNYQNRRAEYVKKFFDIINWDNVAERFQMAYK